MHPVPGVTCTAAWYPAALEPGVPHDSRNAADALDEKFQGLLLQCRGRTGLTHRRGLPRRRRLEREPLTGPPPQRHTEKTLRDKNNYSGGGMRR
jgi:hypothetical protein